MPRRRVTKKELQGIIVPMVTPFKGKYGKDLNLKVLSILTEYLIDNGIHGLMPLGTTGEFGLLNRNERKRVVETVVKATSGRIPVIAGVSSSGTDNAIRLAKDAFSAGADAMISTGPYYYKTDSQGLFLHYKSLLESVGLPLMIYNIPGWAGYNIPAEVVKNLYSKFGERIIGVKFTTNDLGDFLSYLRLLGDKISIMIGSDELALAALSLGAAGAVLGSGNALPKETVRIYEEYVNGNFQRARDAQAKLDPFTQTMVLGTYPSALKFAMRLIRIDCGEVRRPLVPLSLKNQKRVKESIHWKIKNR